VDGSVPGFWQRLRPVVDQAFLAALADEGGLEEDTAAPEEAEMQAPASDSNNGTPLPAVPGGGVEEGGDGD